MISSMPLPLIISFIAFFGCANTLERQIARGVAPTLLVVYFGVSCLLGLGFLIYFGYVTQWYSPLILLLIGAIIGGIIFAILDVILGRNPMILISYIGIPISAYFLFTLIP